MKTREVNFTRENIISIQLPPKGSRIRIKDSKEPGLLLDVTSSGVRTFYVRRKVGSVSKWFRLGAFPDMTVEQARKGAQLFKGSLARGEDPTETRRKTKAEMTLRDLFSEYIERHAKEHTKTWKDMEENFRRYCEPLANRKLSEISYKDASTFQSTLHKTKGIYTSNRMVQLLRAVYNQGKRWRIFDKDNPFQGLPLYKEEKRKRFLSNEEVGRLLIETEKIRTENLDLHDFVHLSLFTGVRKMNLLTARWEHIDLERKLWLIPETKNDESQTIVLQAREIDIFRNRQKQQRKDGIITPFVFAGPGTDGHIKDLKKSWSSLRTRAGVEDCTIHDLRRSLASALAGHNFDIALVKHALNHKDQKTTINVYARVRDDAVSQARSVVLDTWDIAKMKAKTRVTKVKNIRKSKIINKNGF